MELGGKSRAIVLPSADLALAANDGGPDLHPVPLPSAPTALKASFLADRIQIPFGAYLALGKSACRLRRVRYGPEGHSGKAELA